MQHFYFIALFLGFLLYSNNLSAQCMGNPAGDCTVSNDNPVKSLADCAQDIVSLNLGRRGIIDVTVPQTVSSGTINLENILVDVTTGVTITFSGSSQIEIDENTVFCGSGNGTIVNVNGIAFSGNNGATNTIEQLNGIITSCFMTPGSPCATTLSGAVSAVLPVTLLSYEGQVAKSGIDLKWATQDETDNEFFTVERSTDGRVFTEVATIRGQGTTQSATTYEWTDEAPRSGTNFYRLSQTDYDGSHTVLGVVAVDWNGRSVIITPNPVSAGSTILLDLPEEATGQRAELISFDGRRVVAIRLTGAEGRQAQLPVDLARGIYLLRVPGVPGVTPTKLLIE